MSTKMRTLMIKRTLTEMRSLKEQRMLAGKRTGAWKKTLVWLVSVGLLLQLAAGAVLAAEEHAGNGAADLSIAEAQVEQAINDAAAYVRSGNMLSEWAAIGLARSGYSVPASYLASVKRELADNRGEYRRVTDAERVALGVLAAGGDPTRIAGVNLLERIVRDERLDRQGLNGIVFALLAVESANYDVPADAVWNGDKLASYLVDAQNEDGGWPIAAGERSNIDITAMALAALAPFKESERVGAAVDKAVNYLSSVQQENGSFPLDSAESTAQVIVGLTANGIDPQGEKFTKSKGSALSYLLSLRRPDGSFSHLPGEGSDRIATEQALMALAAYRLYMRGHSGLYEGLGAVPVRIVVEGPQETVTAGYARGLTALEALEALLDTQDIPYETERFSFGTMIDSVDGIASGLYGGYDGWFYEVKRAGKWVHPATSLDAFELQPGDTLYVYYSDNTNLIHSVRFDPQVPRANEPFEVIVHETFTDWETGEEIVRPAADLDVTIGGIRTKTDENGVATVDGLPFGVYTVTIEGHRENGAPSVLKTAVELTVAPSGLEAFEDQDLISGWAVPEVERAVALGLFRGTNKSTPVFQPKRSMTRAEYAVVLAKALGADDYAVTSAYPDVPADSWYGGAVASLRAMGVLPAEEETFRPNDPVTREEIAVWTANAFGWAAQSEDAPFRDAHLVSDGALPAIIAVNEHQLMTGYNGFFRPKDTVNRETGAAIAVRVAQLVAAP